MSANVGIVSGHSALNFAKLDVAAAQAIAGHDALDVMADGCVSLGVVNGALTESR